MMGGYELRQTLVFKGKEPWQDEYGTVVGFNKAGDVVIRWEDGCQTAHREDDPNIKEA